MGDRNRVLSRRLQMLARMVTVGNRVADVGCDHAFLSIYLVREGISPGVIAMDVRKGPLRAARAHIDAAELGAYIETRISDGMKELLPGEADTVICAGMGGRLMERILAESMDKAVRLRELILQPQSELRELREFLRGAGFRVAQEDAVCEDGKYYFAMRVLPGGGEPSQGQPPSPQQPSSPEQPPLPQQIRLYDKFGEGLLCKRHPVLKRYLLQQESLLEQLQESLRDRDTQRAEQRLSEVRSELADVRRALEMFSKETQQEGEEICQ